MTVLTLIALAGHCVFRSILSIVCSNHLPQPRLVITEIGRHFLAAVIPDVVSIRSMSQRVPCNKLRFLTDDTFGITIEKLWHRELTITAKFSPLISHENISFILCWSHQVILPSISKFSVCSLRCREIIIEIIRLIIDILISVTISTHHVRNDLNGYIVGIA